MIYRLLEGPEGMTVNTRGELRWDLPPRTERGKQYFVKVEADDGQGGQVVQSFRISI